jgi:hypothetical protein
MPPKIKAELQVKQEGHLKCIDSCNAQAKHAIATSGIKQQSLHSVAVSSNRMPGKTTAQLKSKNKKSTHNSTKTRSTKRKKASTTSIKKSRAIWKSRRRATDAFVRYMRQHHPDGGQGPALLSAFVRSHPGFKSSKLTRTIVDRFSNGMLQWSATSNHLTVTPLVSLPTGSGSFADIQEKDFVYTWVFVVQFAEFLMLKYPDGITLYTATKGFCARLGITYINPRFLKPILIFYGKGLLVIETNENAISTVVKPSKDRRIFKTHIAVLFLSWLNRFYLTQTYAPYDEARERFRKHFSFVQAHVEMTSNACTNTSTKIMMQMPPCMMDANMRKTTADTSSPVYLLEWVPVHRHSTMMALYIQYIDPVITATTECPRFEAFFVLLAPPLILHKSEIRTIYNIRA